MELETIKELSEKGEAEFDIDLDDSLDVPQGENETNKTFKIEEVKDCFNKTFAIRELISLVGSVAIHENDGGNDVDLVLTTSDMSEDLQTAIEFRLFRGFSSYFDIPYEEVSHYLHLHKKESGESPFTSWVPIYKLALIPVPEDERTIRKMSSNDKNEDKKFEILEKSKRRIIAGTIATNAIDAANEEITKEALLNIWKHFQKLPENYRNLMFAHSSSQIGHLIPSYRNRKEAFLDNKIYLIAELRTDLPLANDIWNNILKGDLHSFSIKINIPRPLKKNVKEICNDERCWTQIKDGRFIEVSLTESPANEECSDLQILSKEIK